MFRLRARRQDIRERTEKYIQGKPLSKFKGDYVIWKEINVRKVRESRCKKLRSGRGGKSTVL